MVLFPWPGYTIVSSGKIINFFVIEFIISSKFPVGVSVLPHVPLNKVSPENNNFSSSQYKHELPEVCPGVCKTLNSNSPKCNKSPSSILASASTVNPPIPIYDVKLISEFNRFSADFLSVIICPPYLCFNSFTPPIWSP